jgi:hypothetical protein
MGRRLLLVAPMLFAVLVASGVALALSACGGGAGGGGEEQAKARPLPEEPQDLRPGEYRTEEFKPSASFRVGKSWSTSPPEGSDKLELEYGEIGGLAFSNVRKVYKPTMTATTNVVDAPNDLVGWFQQHPYLQIDKPQPITVGGVKGAEFDVTVAKNLPDDHNSPCGTGCVDIFRQSTGDLPLFVGDKVHLIVLEGVKGQTVTIAYGALAGDFDKVAPEAQKLVDSVEWSGS